MADQTITCPYCNREIALTETLSRQMRESVRKEFEAQALEKEAALKKREDQLVAMGRRIEEDKKAAEEATPAGRCVRSISARRVVTGAHDRRAGGRPPLAPRTCRWRSWRIIGAPEPRRRNDECLP